MNCQMMMSLGVYLLGAGDAGERARVAAHLPGCPECQAELITLAPLPGLLASVPEHLRAAGQLPGAAAGQPTPAGAPSRLGGRSEGGRGGGWRAAAVAACVAAIAGLAGGLWLAPAGNGPQPATVTVSGWNPGTHVSVTAALTTTSWGTSIELRLNGAPLNVQCRLIVRSRTGATEVAGVWDAWRDGPITVPASAGWYPSGIASLAVATPAKTLLTVIVKRT